MDPQNLTAAIPDAQTPSVQAPDLAAIADPNGLPAPQAPGVQPAPEQTDPRLALAAQIIQQEQQRAAALEAQVEAQEAQRINEWYSQLDETQKPFGQWAVSAMNEVKSLQKQVAQLSQENNQLKQTFVPYVRNDRIGQLSKQYSVPREMLEEYGQVGPEVAEAVARAVSHYSKQTQYAQRQAAQLDQAATPSMTATSVPSKEAITQKYARTGDLEGKLRALAQAGLR